MPDLTDRDEWEKKLADALDSELSRFARELSKFIPSLTAAFATIPPEMWASHTDKLIGALAPLLHDVYLARTNEIMGALSFTSVDWGLVDTAASNWARQYSAELITNITDTTRQKVQALIPQYFEQGWTQGQLTEQIIGANSAFSRRRAEVIARTEVTNAASEGAQQTARELAKQGIEMVPVWRTSNDDIVCPICGPRNGLVIQPDNETRGEFPAAHPNCRCAVSYELPQDL